MTTLTATPNLADTGSVRLDVAAAPGRPASAYASNFGAGFDGWTTSGGSLTRATSRTPVSLDQSGAGTASRTVTGLTVGAAYRLRVFYATYNGQLRTGVTGIGTTAYVQGGIYLSTGGGPKYVSVDYNFTATATSHTITVQVARTPGGPTGYSAAFHTITVAPTGAWLGTKITRTDVNGTNVPVRMPVDLDVPNGGTTLTVTDYEAALTGFITYTVTDGLGGTATTTTTLMGEQRRNHCPNPQPLTTTGWTAAAAPSVVVAPWNPARKALSVTATGSTAFYIFGPPSPTAFAIGDVVTVSAMVMIPAGKWYRAQVHAQTGNFYYGAPAMQQSTGAPVLVTATATLTRAETDLNLALLVYETNAGTMLAAGTQVQIGDCLVERAAAALPYFDGGSASAAWLGTANASLSVLYGTPSPAYVWLTLPATSDPASGVAPQGKTLELVTDYAESSDSNGSLHKIIGRADPIANPGPLALRSGTFSLWCSDYTRAVALRALLASGEVAQLRQPDYPDLDVYFAVRSVAIKPDATATPQRWVVDVGYDEVLAA